jgi:hypothetical protein
MHMNMMMIFYNLRIITISFILLLVFSEILIKCKEREPLHQRQAVTGEVTFTG